MAISRSNLALLKYFGVEGELRVAKKPSFAIALNQLEVNVTVEPCVDPVVRELDIDAAVDLERIADFCERLFFVFGLSGGFVLRSRANFPIAFGFAGSAAGFAAISRAFAEAYNLDFSDNRFYDLLAWESGSALRSLAGYDFVFWDPVRRLIQDFSAGFKFPLAVVSLLPKGSSKKEVSSFSLHELVSQSPLYSERVLNFEARFAELQLAMHNQDWQEFSRIVELEALGMLAQAWVIEQPQKLVNETTLQLWVKLKNWAKLNSINLALTCDAGPALHLVCEPGSLDLIRNQLSNWPEIEKLFISRI
jgi:diphosphomevalonate decarboxylase